MTSWTRKTSKMKENSNCLKMLGVRQRKEEMARSIKSVMSMVRKEKKGWILQKVGRRSRMEMMKVEKMRIVKR